MVLKILQANLIFYVVFCDTGKPDGACREAESIQKSLPRCQQSGFNKTTREWEECYFQMENAHCTTETQNRTVQTRRAIVTCFRRDMIVFFRWHLQGKTQSRNVLRASKSFIVFFVAPWNCGNRRFPHKMLLEQGKKCPFHGRCIALTTNECPVSLSKMPATTSGTADCSWGRLVNPEVKASDVFLFGLHPKIKPETFLVGSEADKLEVKASHMLLRGLHPT